MEHLEKSVLQISERKLVNNIIIYTFKIGNIASNKFETIFHTWTLSEPALFKSNGSRIFSTQSVISNLKI